MDVSQASSALWSFYCECQRRAGRCFAAGSLATLGLPWLARLLACIFEVLDSTAGANGNSSHGALTGGGMAGAQARAKALRQLRQLPLLPTARGAWLAADSGPVFFPMQAGTAFDLAALSACGLSESLLHESLDFLHPGLLEAASAANGGSTERAEALQSCLQQLSVRKLEADDVIHACLLPRMAEATASTGTGAGGGAGTGTGATAAGAAALTAAELAGCLAFPLVTGLLRPPAAGAEAALAGIERTERPGAAPETGTPAAALLAQLAARGCVLLAGSSAPSPLARFSPQRPLFLPPEWSVGSLDLRRDFAGVRDWAVVDSPAYDAISALPQHAWRWLFAQLGARAALPLQERSLVVTAADKRASCWRKVPFPGKEGCSSAGADDSCAAAGAGERAKATATMTAVPQAWRLREQRCELLEALVAHVAASAAVSEGGTGAGPASTGAPPGGVRPPAGSKVSSWAGATGAGHKAGLLVDHLQRHWAHYQPAFTARASLHALAAPAASADLPAGAGAAAAAADVLSSTCLALRAAAWLPSLAAADNSALNDGSPCPLLQPPALLSREPALLDVLGKFGVRYCALESLRGGSGLASTLGVQSTLSVALVLRTLRRWSLAVPGGAWTTSLAQMEKAYLYLSREAALSAEAAESISTAFAECSLIWLPSLPLQPRSGAASASAGVEEPVVPGAAAAGRFWAASELCFDDPAGVLAFVPPSAAPCRPLAPFYPHLRHFFTAQLTRRPTAGGEDASSGATRAQDNACTAGAGDDPYAEGNDANGAGNNTVAGCISESAAGSLPGAGAPTRVPLVLPAAGWKQYAQLLRDLPTARDASGARLKPSAVQTHAAAVLRLWSGDLAAGALGAEVLTALREQLQARGGI